MTIIISFITVAAIVWLFKPRPVKPAPIPYAVYEYGKIYSPVPGTVIFHEETDEETHIEYLRKSIKDGARRAPKTFDLSSLK